MSESEGPGRGHGTAQPGGPRFNNLVQNLLNHEHAPTTSKDNINDLVEPSKKIPGTGLKRNTQQWKDEHPEEAKAEEKRGGRSRASSSSSIPSGATSGEDERTEAEKNRGQEGPRGRGPGRHEEELKRNDKGKGWFGGLRRGDKAQDGEDRDGVMDSPTEDEQRQDPFLPGRSDQPNDSGIPQSQAPKDPSAHTRSDEPLEGHDHPNSPSGSKSEEREKPQKKLNEVFEGRDSERERKLTDEMGRRPSGLPGVKDEDPPGPRNEIVLDPRVTHMNVSWMTGSEVHNGRSSGEASGMEF